MNAPKQSSYASNWGEEHVSKSLARGTALLLLRQVFVQALNIGGGIFLARFLGADEFGLYAIVLFFLAFLLAFGDAGLAASLIRSHHEPTSREYSAVFTAQLFFVCVAGGLFWFLSPWLAQAYSVASSDVWVFRLLAVSLVATSFIVIPQVRLERELRFDKIALVDATQAIVFNLTAVLLAWAGYGALSFGLAMLARAMIGVLFMNVISKTGVSLLWDWTIVKSHMRFGLPFQGSKVVCFLKDSITPIFIGLVINAEAVGYLNWAGLLANYPVIGLFVLQRIYMPAFARMQLNPAALSKLVSKVVWATNALVAPLAVLTLVLSEEITLYVFGEKWLAALYLLPFMWTANLFLPTVTPAMGLLDALGHSKVNLRATVLWMILTWGLGLPMLYLWGLKGFVSAVVIVNLSHVLLIRSAQRIMPFSVLSNVWGSWSLAALMGIVLLILNQIYPIQGLLMLLLYLLLGCLGYLVALYKAYPGYLSGWFRAVRV